MPTVTSVGTTLCCVKSDELQTRAGCTGKWVYVTTRRPTRVIQTCCGLVWVCCLITGGAGWATFSNPGQYDWTVGSDAMVTERDAVTLAIEATSLETGDTENAIKPRDKPSLAFHAPTFMWTWKDASRTDHILTPANLVEICKVERIIFNTPEWDKFCPLQYGVNETEAGASCAAQGRSIAEYFYSRIKHNASATVADEVLCPAGTSWLPELPSGTSCTNVDHKWACDLLDAAAVKQVSDDMWVAMRQPGTIGALQQQDKGFWLDTDALTTNKTLRTRSIVSLGTPLKGYTSENDQLTEQNNVYWEFTKVAEANLFKHFGVENTFFKSAYRNKFIAGELSAEMWCLDFQQTEFQRVSNSDFSWVLGSVLFVWLWILNHVGSIFLSGAAMFQIFFSLPCAIFLSRVVFQCTYFTNVHILAVFISLGIGADDIFVLVDAWKQSAEVLVRGPSESAIDFQERRMYYAFARTVKAVFNTSFTTAMAFVATAISPIMPISSLGIFAALAIVMNYVLCIVLVPALIIVHHRRYEGRTCGKVCCDGRCCGGCDNPNPVRGDASAAPGRCCCCEGCADIDKFGTGDGDGDGDGNSNGGGGGGRGAGGGGGREMDSEAQSAASASVAPVGSASASASSSKAAPAKLLRRDSEMLAKPMWTPERVLMHWYWPCLSFAVGGKAAQKKPCAVRPAPIVAIVALLSLSAYMVTQATKLEPPVKQEAFFSEDHQFTGFIDAMASEYMSGDDSSYETMNLVFGVDGVDREAIKTLADGSELVWDFWKPDYRGAVKWGATALDLSSAAKQQYVLDMCKMLRDKPCDEQACSGTFNKLMMPGKVTCFMEDFLDWHNRTAAASRPSITTRATFNERLKAWHDALMTPARMAELGDEAMKLKATVGFLGTGSASDLKFFAITGVMTLKALQPAEAKREIMVLTQAMREDMEKAPGAVGSIKIDCGLSFSWYATEMGLVQGLFNGLAMMFPIILAVLVLATGNILLGFYATLCIGCVVGCVLGWCHAVEGWSLGIAESIAGVIIIGFSVDYVVHLGHMYAEAGEDEAQSREDRYSRTEYSLDRMGGTVFAGAVTTLGSGLFMFGCQMTFFTKMAILLSVTISFSFVFAVVLFLSFTILIGPNGETCSLHKCLGRGGGEPKKSRDDAGDAPGVELREKASSPSRGSKSPTKAGEVEIKQGSIVLPVSLSTAEKQA